MSTLKIKENHIKSTVFAVTAAFICLSALTFVPVNIPYRICFAVGLLSMASLWLTSWEITAALIFSALGDLAGSCGILPMQMGLFAVAHILYIVFFIRRFIRKGTKMTAKMKGFLMMLGICIASLLTMVFIKIVPAAPSGIIRTGTVIYAVIICLMLLTALMQRSLIYAIGALLFVISDFTLAWTMFVEPVPNAELIVLSTYFAAQWLLFVRASPYRVAHPVHLMRF